MKNLLYATLFLIFAKVPAQQVAVQEPLEPQWRLVQKGNNAFDRMWYAKAAEFYEKALAQNSKNRVPSIMQKAADSYYYDTDMEHAYKWYDELYKNYENEMAPDALYRYFQSLEGVGKYHRANQILEKYRSLGNKDLRMTEAEYRVFLDSLQAHPTDYAIHDLEINTPYSEFGPVFYKEGVLFAAAKEPGFSSTKEYKWNEEPWLDLYYAQRNTSTQELSQLERLPDNINSKYHEADAALSPDGKTLYFTRNNFLKKYKLDAENTNNLKIYRSKLVNGQWTDPEELPFDSDNYSTGHPALNADGSKLYFISDMPGSIGMTDIFVVDILPDGGFSTPHNLGPKVNTVHREMFPYVYQNHLYFASDGLPGMGGLDVFEADFMDNGQGVAKPHNMGLPINSNTDDFSLIINEAEGMGYFASNREGGKGDDDLYSFSKTILWAGLQGTVTDTDTHLPLANAQVEVFDESQNLLVSLTTDADGNYAFKEVDPNTAYAVRAKLDGYKEDGKSLKTLANQMVNADLSLKPLAKHIVEEAGVKKIKINDIHFDFDHADIRNDASHELATLIDVMKEYPNMVIKIESYTDSRGSKEYNRDLSDRRAKSTRDYIISQGIAPNRIESAIGYGEASLINGCSDGVSCSLEQHEANRRSEFIIIKM